MTVPTPWSAKYFATTAAQWSTFRASPSGRRNRELWSELRKSRRGDTCVLMGNGPSLRSTPFDLLADVPVFGLNKVHLLAEITNLKPHYVAAVNQLVIEQSRGELLDNPAALFLPLGAGRELAASRPVCLLPPGQDGTFATSINSGFWEGFTVTYVALQVAYVLGFRRVVLIGVDHRFSASAQGAPNETVAAGPSDVDHFHPAYFPPGADWQLPDLVNSERAYRRADRAYRKDGRVVLDATTNGALQVFPKVSLRDALVGT